MSIGPPPVPQESDLYERISARALGADPGRVREVLAEHGVHLRSPLPARRQLVVHRLYCDGTKSGTDDNDGPFSIDMPLGPGPWAIASTINSAGKSSLLWALSFALRGEGFNEFRRPETVGWFSYVRADLEVAGVAVSVRLMFDRPGHPSARLLTADALDALLGLQGRQETGPGVRTAATAEPDGVKDLIDRFMLDRLGLRPIAVWTAEPGAPQDAEGNRDSTEQVHRWASYFYAIALNSANDRILLGPTAVGQLPVKLMQLFLDVPYAAELTHLTTGRKRATQDELRIRRRAKEDTQARQEQTEPLRQALAAARDRLAQVQAGQPDLPRLLAEADDAARQVAADQAAHRQVAQQHDDARKARLKDERDLRRARQSSAARLLLGALDPEACPRCDHEIDEQRRQTEDTEHRCSICAHPLPEVHEDPDAQAAALQRLQDRLQASRTAEASAQRTLQAADAALRDSRDAYEQARARLADARSQDWFRDLEAARREVDQLQGALALATGTDTGAGTPIATEETVANVIEGYRSSTATKTEGGPIEDDLILTAAADVLTEIVGEHSRALFAELNEEITAIARNLGTTNLTSVNLALNGNINAHKSGGRHRFADFSGTDRLRMRIATVVAMIKVGRRHGIMSHPGLLLIDAPTAEELVREHAYLTIKTLYETGVTVPGMQIIITSIDDAVWQLFPEDRIVTSGNGRHMF